VHYQRSNIAQILLEKLESTAVADVLIHLVRHALAENQGDDPELSAAGIAQASALGRRFSADPPAAIVHSGLRRAEQTARILGSATGVPPVRSEVADDLTPIPVEADVSSYPKRRLPWFDTIPMNERDPGGEKIGRSFASLVELAAGAGSTGILVVTHAFVIGAMVQRALGLRSDQWLEFQSDNTGLTSIRRRPDGSLSLVRFNDTGHLI
jgi:broad specificity phosphatase PhoE